MRIITIRMGWVMLINNEIEEAHGQQAWVPLNRLMRSGMNGQYNHENQNRESFVK